MQRLLGILLLIRSITPILVILIIAWVGSIIINDLQNAFKIPAEKIELEVEKLQTTVSSMQDDFAAVTEAVQTIGDEISAITNLSFLPDLPDNLSIPNINIPDPTLTVPDIDITWSRALGIRYPSSISIGTQELTIDIPSIPGFSLDIPFTDEIEQAFSDFTSNFTGAFAVFDQAFTSIGNLAESLQSTGDSISTIVSEFNKAIASVIRIAQGWVGAFGIALLVIFLLILNYFGAAMIQDFRRGWQMLLGRPVS